MKTVIFFLAIIIPSVQAQNKALRGYDPVSYFTQNKAAKGYDSISTQFSGVYWFFSSLENQKTFIESPEKFMPQFDGYCAYAAANNYIYDADPEAWTIVDGRLYLNYSTKVRATWLAQRDSMITSGHKNWPGLKHQKK